MPVATVHSLGVSVRVFLQRESFQRLSELSGDQTVFPQKA